MRAEEALAPIVDGLRAKRIGQHRWQARCPAHDDAKPSLALAASTDGTVLFHCHAGCTQQAVLNALRDRGLWRGRQQQPSSSKQKGTCRDASPHNSSDQTNKAPQLDKARWLWKVSVPGPGTLVERYLASRGIPGQVPPSLRFLHPQKADHHVAMIAAFGLPHEIEPGTLFMPPSMVMGVHLTLLRRDGAGKAGTARDKLMIGPSSGWPLVVAPVNDVGGLAIAEGIEDALSLHRATGLGAWAAGAASRLGKLAEIVPLQAECVTVVEDDDKAGRRGACELADGLVVRGMEVMMLSSRVKRSPVA